MEHLILKLQAPLMAFGGEAIDQHGRTRDFPSASMLTGLIANALGWERSETNRVDRLQDRLVFAVCMDRPPSPLMDFQTAALRKDDRGWTTNGEPEGRSFDGTHVRYQEFLADAALSVALRFDPDEEPGQPGLFAVRDALREPERPLFIGRKSCLPERPLYDGMSNGPTALAALIAHNPGSESCAAQWPDGEGAEGVMPARTFELTDRRNWGTRLHGGGRLMHEGTL